MKTRNFPPTLTTFPSQKHHFMTSLVVLVFSPSITMLLSVSGRRLLLYLLEQCCFYSLALFFFKNIILACSKTVFGSGQISSIPFYSCCFNPKPAPTPTHTHTLPPPTHTLSILKLPFVSYSASPSSCRPARRASSQPFPRRDGDMWAAVVRCHSR